jgi:heme exporter protein D
MAFDSWADFMAMGKHGVYVWSSYGLTFAVIARVAMAGTATTATVFASIISNN